MVAVGDVAVVHYVARLADEDGDDAVVDTSDVDVALSTSVYHGHRDYKPISFEVGAGEVLPAVDELVREMSPGEERTATVDADGAFGTRDAVRVVKVPRAVLEGEDGPEARPYRLVGSDTGEMGWITAVTPETVTVDFNHELAGERLTFEVRLLAVRTGGDDGDVA